MRALRVLQEEVMMAQAVPSVKNVQRQKAVSANQA